MKHHILHLASDDKFIRHAYAAFEAVAPGENEYIVYSRGKPAFVADIPHRQVGPIELMSSKFYASLAGYRFVVLHSLTPAWVNVVNKAPEGVTFIWLGWGFDYYDLLPSHHSLHKLLLEKTQHLCRGLERRQRRRKLTDAARRSLRAFLWSGDKLSALKRISLFAPVLYEDYILLKEALGESSIPPYISWNYGSLEDVLLHGAASTTISGNDILVGNSASPNNNHEDALALLAAMGRPKGSDKIIAPLSYGDREYAKLIAASGRSMFGSRFVPLMNFMSVESYTRKIASCSHVIMNHRRQQALGNIVTMLHLGAAVFLREESPVYAFFKNQGATLWSIQQLQNDPALFDVRPSVTQVEQNREILRAHWSREVILAKTHRLIIAGDAASQSRALHAP